MEKDVSELSRAQRKKMRKEERKQGQQQENMTRQKIKTNRKIRNYVIAIVIIAAIALLFYSRSIPPDNSPVISMEKTSYNLGEVSQRNGVVEVFAGISNTGEGDLIIKGITTSCMCTSASLIYDGKESQKFGMHTSGGLWSQTIKQGEEAQLKISYDPNVHPELRGPVTRVVTVYSNDPKYSQKEIKVYLTQVN